MAVPLVPLAAYAGMVSELPHAQQGGTCYAHACATALAAAECRIVGRVPMDHAQIVKEITDKHGVNGGSVRTVLGEQCPKRQLHYREVDVQGASAALKAGRAVLACYSLAVWQWRRWDDFFKKARAGDTLTAADLQDSVFGRKSWEDMKSTGHAFVIVADGGEYWKVKNSWGEWMERGYARIDKRALSLNFFDIFFYESELGPQDRVNFGKAPISAKLKVHKAPLSNFFPALGQGTITCARRSPGAIFEVRFQRLNNAGVWQDHPAHPVALGSSKRTFSVVDVNTGERLALKSAVSDVLLADFHTSVQVALWCDEYLNSRSQSKIKVCLPDMVKVDLGDGRGLQLALLEPWLPGKYEKFALQDSDPCRAELTSFLHYTYLASGGEEMVWDLQGVRAGDEYHLTDVSIVDWLHPSVFGNVEETFRKLHPGGQAATQCKICAALSPGVSIARSRTHEELRSGIRKCCFFYGPNGSRVRIPPAVLCWPFGLLLKARVRSLAQYFLRHRESERCSSGAAVSRV